MRNFKINWSSLLFAVVMFVLSAPIIGPEASAAFVVGGLVYLQFMPENQIIGFRNEVLRRVFSAEIQRNLYPDGSFYKNARRDTGVPISAGSIEIPQAGPPPDIIKNPTILPIPAYIPKDLKKSYDVDLYASRPVVLTDVNKDWVSYDKKSELILDHSRQLEKYVQDETAVIWLPSLASNILRTTGANNTGTKVTGMTGNRKEITYQDIIDVATLLDKMNIPDDGRRCMLVYTEQIAEIKKIPELRDFDKTGIAGMFATGSVGRLQNMNVYKRSVPLLYNNGTPPSKKAVGAAVATTDNLAILAWHPDFVRVAEGVVEVYIEMKKPGYQGDLFNAAVRGGAMISRLDEAGVVALVQG